jgi:hypothetical protein
MSTKWKERGECTNQELNNHAHTYGETILEVQAQVDLIPLHLM